MFSIPCRCQLFTTSIRTPGITFQGEGGIRLHGTYEYQVVDALGIKHIMLHTFHWCIIWNIYTFTWVRVSSFSVKLSEFLKLTTLQQKYNFLCMTTLCYVYKHLDLLPFQGWLSQHILGLHMGWVGLWGFLWWAPSAKKKYHQGVGSGWSSTWFHSKTGLSSAQYEQISIIFGVWPFWLIHFFFRSITFWWVYG